MAEDEKEAGSAENESSSAAAPAAAQSKLPVIFGLVNFLMTVGIAIVLFLAHQEEKNKPSIEDIVANATQSQVDGDEGQVVESFEDSQNFGIMVTLEQFTINLATVGSVNPKYVRVNIALEVANDDVEEEIEKKMPHVRNTVFDLFNSKRPSDLATAEGRSFLKEEIQNALNSFLVTGKIKGVYFTNFAVAG